MISALLFSMLLAQSQPTAATPDRRSVTPAQHYLNAKGNEFRSRDAAARTLGADAKVRGVLTILQQKGAFAKDDVIGSSEAEKDAVRNALRETAARNMVAFGLGPDELQGPRGDERVAAVERLTAGSEKLDDLVLLGERIVVAEVVDDLPANVRSRLGKEITFKVVEVVKGPAGPPSFRTGRAASSLFAAANTGQQYLFFLSPSVAAFKRAENVPLSGPDTAFQFVPYALQNGQLVRLDSGQTAANAATIETVRALAKR